MESVSWKTIFMGNNERFSSKRILGALGVLVCLGLLIAAFITQREVPTFGDMVLITSTSLLGLDTFKGIFNKNASSH